MNDFYHISNDDNSWFIRRLVGGGYEFCLLNYHVIDWHTSKSKFADLAAELPPLYRVPDSSVLLKLGELP